MFKNLFNKLTNNKLIQQDEQNDLLDAVNRARMIQGGNNSVIATPEQANLLNQQFQKINNDMGFGKNLENIEPIQTNNINNNGGIKTKLVNYLLGEKVTPEAQSSVNFDENGDVSLKIGTGNDYRVGGAFKDFSDGFRENRNNPISLENFGQNKNIATKLGEGFGSVARFADTPLGRALIVGGLVGTTGGNGLEALAYGATAGANNQKNRNEDKMFRNDLINTQQNYLRNSAGWNELSDTEKAQVLSDVKTGEGYDKLSKDEQDRIYNQAMNDYLTDRQQKQLNDVADNINSQRGYMTNDVYNNLIRSQQIRDNAEFRNMQLANQQEQNKIMNQLRRDQFKAKQEQNEFNNWYKKQSLANEQQRMASDNAYKNAQLGLGWANYNLDNYKAKHPNMSAADRKAEEKARQSQNTVNMINTAMNTVQQNPNAFKWTTGMLGADVANRLDPKGVQARSVVNSVTAEYRKYLTGAQMSDRERKDYEKFLPAPTDNAKIIQDKLSGMMTVISAREGINAGGNGGGTTLADPLGIR